ncbi:MAG: response regulator [Lachnospiraceae bacterium]|nr:response regulator [Lachnospiraceae bacterium]MCR5427600.1 response regulator [Lachnospiraceae bacterium]
MAMDKLKATVFGDVAVICQNDSFLAKSLCKKLCDIGLRAEFFHTEIREMKEIREDTELFILFLNENIDRLREAMVFLKDKANDRDRKIMMIGDQDEYEAVLKIIPETAVLDLLKRPLDMDELLRRAVKYIEENTGENRKRTVLIVDDDITYMRTVYEWLKNDYVVGMASNGVQAISYLARNKADIVLLDYEMPVANGPQVLEMLKTDSETGQIPVMFLTGHGDKKSVLSVIDLQPVDYLLKTIDKKTLLGKLSNFFGKNE